MYTWWRRSMGSMEKPYIMWRSYDGFLKQKSVWYEIWEKHFFFGSRFYHLKWIYTIFLITTIIIKSIQTTFIKSTKTLHFTNSLFCCPINCLFFVIVFLQNSFEMNGCAMHTCNLYHQKICSFSLSKPKTKIELKWQ